MSEEIIITVDKDGQVSLNTEGFNGPACEEQVTAIIGREQFRDASVTKTSIPKPGVAARLTAHQ